MADRITQQEYWAQVDDIATEIIGEALQVLRDGGNRDRAEERAHDALHEMVDGHQWIIYYGYNLQVLEHTDNDDAYFDNFGPLEADSATDAFQKMAYAALEADVQEKLADRLSEALDEAEEQLEEEEEEGGFEFR